MSHNTNNIPQPNYTPRMVARLRGLANAALDELAAEGSCRLCEHRDGEIYPKCALALQPIPEAVYPVGCERFVERIPF